ncbi:uncharacterized protein DDB_G0290685-like [Drosophila ficusphila]|uniref:uncharacterized protein DDB_G0290685-like n=1 Tax=Drosophila ficusphila TaxID=30025 RepID=UPI001C8A88E7|nr:uncharacterized protein DDB_G0290685-like [Drosophila ficusphila]
MPAMLEPLILGMDFLASIGTTLRCGTASLTLSRRRPRDDEPTRRNGPKYDNQGNHSEPPPRPRPRRPLSHKTTPRTSSTPSTEPRLGIANHDLGPQDDNGANVPEENTEENTENTEENTENNEENTENNEENTKTNEENHEARISTENNKDGTTAENT